MEFVLAISWCGYYLLHSLLAADKVKEGIKNALGMSHQRYRLVYSVVASIGLLGLIFLYLRVPYRPLFDPGAWLKYLSLVFASFGIILINSALKTYGFSRFVGLSPEVSGSDTLLITTGLLGQVRHPIYSGVILICIGWFLYTPTVASAISVAAPFYTFRSE